MPLSATAVPLLAGRPRASMRIGQTDLAADSGGQCVPRHPGAGAPFATFHKLGSRGAPVCAVPY